MLQFLVTSVCKQKTEKQWIFFQKDETEEKLVARYLVGPYNNSWNFMDALEKAQDGDTIEFENGYAFQWPTNKVIEIDKRFLWQNYRQQLLRIVLLFFLMI